MAVIYTSPHQMDYMTLFPEHQATELEKHLTGELAYTLQLKPPMRVQAVNDKYAIMCGMHVIAILYVEGGDLKLQHRDGLRLLPATGQIIERFPLADYNLIELIIAKVHYLCQQFTAMRSAELKSKQWGFNESGVLY